MHAFPERVAIVATCDPDAYGTGTSNSDVIDMLSWQEVIFTVMSGDLGSSGTLDFAVKGDTASNGSFTTTITGKSIAQMTQAGTDSDKQAMIRVTDEEVAAQGFRYLRGLLTIGVAGSEATVLVQGVPKHFGPVGDFDLSSVDEIVY